MTVWNKIDAVAAPESVRAVASAREGDGTVCISAATGEGITSMLALLDRYIAALLLPVQCMLPFSQVRGVTGGCYLQCTVAHETVLLDRAQRHGPSVGRPAC